MTFINNIDKQLRNVNVLLLEFMTSITATVHERQHFSLGKETNVSKHVKKVRNYFALCLLQYCTIPKQPTPFHNLMADMVEICGGLVN